jgi:hypothetical protein
MYGLSNELMDPLVCPQCGGAMRILAFIEQPETIEKILTHLGVWPAHPHSPPAGVPVAISPAWVSLPRDQGGCHTLISG